MRNILQIFPCLRMMQPTVLVQVKWSWYFNREDCTGISGFHLFSIPISVIFIMCYVPPQLISTCHWVVRELCRAYSFKTLNGRSLSSWILGRKDPGMTKRTHRGRREITDVSRPLGRWASGTRLEFADERLAPRREEQEGVDGNYVSLRSRHRTCNCLQRGKGSTCHRVSFNWHLRIGSCTASNTKSHSVVIFIGHATVH